jgi:proteasome lid subunit RPN8/RPN11
VDVTATTTAPNPAGVDAAADDAPADPVTPVGEPSVAETPADQPATVAAPADVATAEERDAAAIDSQDWPGRPLAGPLGGVRAAGFQVVYRQSALDAIHLHGQTRTDVEVGGVLIGTGCRDESGPYLLVEHAIAGTAANSRSTNVTFTADAWQQIQTVMDRDYPDKKMVGWYHTHPGFGIFLSGMDVFICDNFFNLPWQVAFVYDPIGGDEGNFVWRGGKPTREPVLLEDDVTPAAAEVPLMPVAEAMTGSDPAGTGMATAPALGDGAAGIPYDGPPISPDLAALQSQVIELMARVRRLEARQRPLLIGMVFVLAFGAMWAIQQWPSATPPAAQQPSAQPAPGPLPQPANPPGPSRTPQGH